MGKFIDMTGKKLGRLTVMSCQGKNDRGSYLWLTKCECGKEKIVEGVSLRSGHTRSCGCLQSPKEEEYLDRLKERLLKYSEIKGACREWNVKNRVSSTGYGFLNFRSKQIMAHRAAFIVWKGGIPKGKWVLHSCDNRLCINPDHLFLGDHTANMKDMVSKNRQNNISKGSKGIENASCKLCEHDVNAIRMNWNTGFYSIKSLAKLFGMHIETVRQIVKWKIWTHLKDPQIAYDKLCKEMGIT